MFSMRFPSAGLGLGDYRRVCLRWMMGTDTELPFTFVGDGDFVGSVIFFFPFFSFLA